MEILRNGKLFIHKIIFWEVFAENELIKYMILGDSLWN